MRKIITLLISLFLVFALSACGSSGADLTAVLAERDILKMQYETAMNQLELTNAEMGRKQAELDSAAEQYNTIHTEFIELEAAYKELQEAYDTLVSDTADWRELNEDQKAAQLAQAEADRITAEEAAKKAAAERAAAEKAAEEEAARKAAEEAAAKEAEEKKGYNTGITYDDLARNPEDFKGKKVKFTGEVLQVSEVQNEIQIRLATKRNNWGGYSDDVVYLYFDSSLISSRILEDDIITIYGVAKGLHSYTTVLGAKVTLPLIAVDKIDT